MSSMKKILGILLFGITLGFTPACSELGLAPAQSLSQQIAYGYSTVASVRSTAADLLVAKRIDVSDAKMVQSMADQARAALDIARGASAQGKPKDAQASLALAQNVLMQIQTYLATKKE